MVISQKLLNPGETILVSTRTHLKAMLFPLLQLVVLLAIGVAAQVLVDNDTVVLVVWAIVLVLALWRFVWPLLGYLTASYTITNRRLLTRNGVITRRGHDIPLSRISDVASERDIIDRMLGCGTLVVADASTNGQVLLYDIPHVEDVQRQLNDILYKLSAGEPTGAGDH